MRPAFERQSKLGGDLRDGAMSSDETYEVFSTQVRDAL